MYSLEVIQAMNAEKPKSFTPPRVTVMRFEDWKQKFEPRIYESSREMCEEQHADDDCVCEYLYSFELSELEQDEDEAPALRENRVWTWRSDGTIVTGIDSDRADLLVTKRAYSEPMIVA